MAKSSKSYCCQSCGAVTSKWSGKCESCNEWNTITEEIIEASVPKGLGSARKGNALQFEPLKSDKKEKKNRHISNIAEFDRVTGGGLVEGSAILIGGDPGIGKSTLLLQVVCKLAMSNKKCVYVSGEEATDQIRMRAERLELQDAPVDLVSATSVRDIIASIDHQDAPDLLVIDSIQTMYVDTVDSAPGTVTQVRTAASELIRAAKRRGICVLFVGHVTKEGQIAGPRVLEHLVDAVLYFEGDRGHQFRILRTVKNRFGPTDEIGVFEMTHDGLSEVANPSALFLSQRQDNVAGSAVFAGLEGTRPMLVEIQALVAPTAFGNPRRAVIGWDANRLAMILAVLDTRCGLSLSEHDIFLNVAGGIRINEPAADLAVAAALISSQTDKPVTGNTVFFGEIGLSGEIRTVSQPDLRMKEASKLGFEQAVIPTPPKKKKVGAGAVMQTKQIDHLTELVTQFTPLRRAA